MYIHVHTQLLLYKQATKIFKTLGNMKNMYPKIYINILINFGLTKLLQSV